MSNNASAPLPPESAPCPRVSLSLAATNAAAAPDLRALTRRLRGLARAEGLELAASPSGAQGERGDAWITIPWLQTRTDAPFSVPLSASGRPLGAEILARYRELSAGTPELGPLLEFLSTTMRAIATATRTLVQRLPAQLATVQSLREALHGPALLALPEVLTRVDPSGGFHEVARGAVQLAGGGIAALSATERTWDLHATMEATATILEWLPPDPGLVEELLQDLEAGLGPAYRGAAHHALRAYGGIAVWRRQHAALGGPLDLAAWRTRGEPIQVRVTSGDPAQTWAVARTPELGAFLHATLNGVLPCR